jgi:hypothetical protein
VLADVRGAESEARRRARAEKRAAAHQTRKAMSRKSAGRKPAARKPVKKAGTKGPKRPARR